MESEEINGNEHLKSGDKKWSVGNNNACKVLRNTVSWTDMYEVGVIGLIDQDEGVGGSNSPSSPRSSSDDLLLSSPETYDPSDRTGYHDRKRQKLSSIFSDSSPKDRSYNDKDNMFDCLSDEIILYIFSLVPKQILPRLSLVCKRFRELSLDESLWPRCDLSFKTLQPHTLGYVLTRGVRALRLNSSGVLSPLFDYDLSLQDDYKFKVEYLDLSAVHISVKDLELLLLRCNNLRKLSVEACELNDRICEAISLNPKLDTIDMAMCSNLSDEGLRIIVSKCQKLESVNISWCNLSAGAVSSFCKNISPCLISLNLAGSLKSLSNEDIETLVSCCPELTELDISDCIKITGAVISCILDSADNLQTLSISRSYKITAASVLQLKAKASLCFLNMFGNITGNMFPTDHMKYLKSALPGVSINADMMSSIARPTVGIRRTSIWGIRCRE